MLYVVTVEEFNEWLKKKGIYEQFYKNMKEIGKWSEEEIKNEYFDRYHPTEWLTQAFNWKESPEGRDFWDDVETLWNNYYFCRFHEHEYYIRRRNYEN